VAAGNLRYRCPVCRSPTRFAGYAFRLSACCLLMLAAADMLIIPLLMMSADARYKPARRLP